MPLPFQGSGKTWPKSHKTPEISLKLPARSHQHHRCWILSIYHHIEWTRTIPLQLQNQNTPRVFCYCLKIVKWKKKKTAQYNLSGSREVWEGPSTLAVQGASRTVIFVCLNKLWKGWFRNFIFRFTPTTVSSPFWPHPFLSPPLHCSLVFKLSV